MTNSNSNKTFLFLIVLLGVLCSSYTIVNNSSSTNSTFDFEIQVLDELIIDSLSDNSNDSLLVEEEEINEEDSSFMFLKNPPHYKQCAHLETNLERDQCTKKLIQKKLINDFYIPTTEMGKTINGIIIIEFIVSKTGDITNIKIVKGINKELDKEAIRVVKKLPKMIPGENNSNENISVSYNIPIRINLR